MVLRHDGHGSCSLMGFDFSEDVWANLSLTEVAVNNDRSTNDKRTRFAPFSRVLEKAPSPTLQTVIRNQFCFDGWRTIRSRNVK